MNHEKKAVSSLNLNDEQLKAFKMNLHMGLELAQYTDKHIGNQEADFYSDVKFLDELMLALIERVDDNEKQDKVLNMIKCMNL